MSNMLLALQNDNTDLATEDKFFKDLAGGGAFLPRIQLYTNASSLCKSGDFPANHWGLSKGQDTIDLGKEVQVVPVAMRFKALDLRDGVLSYFNPATDTFQQIKDLSADSESKCMAGTEFLLWLPEQAEFCTFFAYNKSSKQEAPKIRSLIGKAAVLTSRYVKNTKDAKKSFQAPVCNESSTPVTSLPEQEDLDSQIDKFKNAKDSQVTTASEKETQATSRVQ
jgi:hypothetical protein